MDEIFNGMDSNNKIKSLNLLEKELAHIQTVYLIDHNPEVIEKLDNKITIRKSDGISSIER
jgi:ABC-type multidrug transport system ATPase subunit